MKANQERVNQAVEMRRQGKTFSEISSVMGTNKSTLRKWFSSVVFTPEETCLIDQNILSRRTNRLKKTLTSDNKKIEGLAPTAKNYTKYLQAIEFRKNGCGLEDIANRLCVAKSTISLWVRHIQLNEYQKKCLMGCEPGKISPARQKAVEANRKKYANLRNSARQQGYDEALGDPTHVAGCMLYWAEGTKSINKVEFSNTDASMQKKFKEFLEHLGARSEKIKFYTRVHNTEENGTHEECKTFWAEKLNISKSQIKVYDAKDARGDSKTKSRYPFGVGRLEVHDYTIIQRIYGGIERYIGEEIPYGRK